MNKSKRKRFFSAIALCTVSAAMLMTTACGKPASDGRIAVICKTQGVSFWDDVKKGAEDAGEELGYDIDYYIASGDNDYASQIEYINEAIDNKVKAIVIAPNGNSELDEAFAKAENAGIKLINIKHLGLMLLGSRHLSISGLSNGLHRPSTLEGHRRWKQINTTMSHLSGCRI